MPGNKNRLTKKNRAPEAGAHGYNKKSGPVITDLLLEDGFSVLYPHRRLQSRVPGLAVNLGGMRSGMPSIMQIVEITDNADRTLMCMPPGAAVRQRLHHRAVCMALLAKKGTLFLHKRTDPILGHPGCWDLYSGLVLMGEAREDAAIRLLRAKTDLEDISLTLAAEHKSTRETPLHITLFTARLPKGVFPAQDYQGFLEVDADELAGLIRHTPELFTPALLWAAQSGRLFS